MNRRCPNCHSENDVNSKIHFCRNCGNLLFPIEFVDLGLSVLWSDSYYKESMGGYGRLFTYSEALALCSYNQFRWTLPSETHCEELKKRCKWKLIENNGNYYYNVIGPNGNSIMLSLLGWFPNIPSHPSGKIIEKNTSGVFWCHSFPNKNVGTEYIFRCKRDFLGGKHVEGYVNNSNWINYCIEACVRPIKKI